MNDDDDDSDENTLENGRRQLQLLSRQLQEQKNCDHSLSSSNRQNLQVERKILDQKPRGDRLKNRKGSPLGLTLEELDDRGLLDGGGVVPSYYTSLKQKQRRALELQRRSSRMKLRGQDESKAYSHDVLMRMIRVFSRWGVRLEELLLERDTQCRGLLLKDHFVRVLKDFGLPFSVKDINSFVQTFAVSREHVDYETFLQEVAVNIEPFTDVEKSSNRLLLRAGGGGGLMSKSSSLGNVMRDLYRMLNDSKKRLNKSVDEIYRMFSCWDHGGKGVVTSTQFFRVLSQMHVTFSDDEQDFIVELLDTTLEGKINFDGLLNYCFDDFPNEDRAPDSGGGDLLNLHGCGDESVISNEGGSTADGTVSATDVRSVTSGSAAKRPHTAAAFRSTFHEGNRYVCDITRQDDGDSFANNSCGLLASPIGGAGRSGSVAHPPPQRVARRPLTAAARVAHTGPAVGVAGQGRTSTSQRGDDGHNFILDISSDSDNDESEQPRGVRYCGSQQELMPSALQDYRDGHDEHQNLFGGDGTMPVNSNTPAGGRSSVTAKPLRSSPMWRRGDAISGDMESEARSFLSNLRNAVIVRHNQFGLNLREIFDLFDKRCIRYIDAGDFLKTSLEFKIELNVVLSRAMVRLIALDGVDRISFSEFAVWITDPDHEALQTRIQIQIAEQLEQQGREYQYLIFRELSQGSGAGVGAGVAVAPATSGLVSVSAFVQALKMIGLQLDQSEMDRTILRFDTHGSDQCSVSRFMRMAQNNEHWKNAVETLAYHEEAVEEAQVVRQRIHSGSRRAIATEFDDETLDMAEYLGIRVLSEPHLLWIVAEAIRAPLPPPWTLHQDQQGRTFFFNPSTQATRWDHPADPELRKLRNLHRRMFAGQHDNHASVPSQMSDCAEMYAPPLHIYHRHSDEVGDHRSSNKGSHSLGKSNMADSRPRDKHFKMNTILLFNKSANSNMDKKSARVANSEAHNCPPKSSSLEKKRAVSAGRTRNGARSAGSQLQSNKALEYMYSDQVIEELDLAMQAKQETFQLNDHGRNWSAGNNRPQSQSAARITSRGEKCLPQRQERKKRDVNAKDMVWL